MIARNHEASERNALYETLQQSNRTINNNAQRETYFIRYDHVTGIFLSLLSDLVEAAISGLLHKVDHDFNATREKQFSGSVYVAGGG